MSWKTTTEVGTVYLLCTSHNHPFPLPMPLVVNLYSSCSTSLSHLSSSYTVLFSVFIYHLPFFKYFSCKWRSICGSALVLLLTPSSPAVSLLHNFFSTFDCTLKLLLDRFICQLLKPNKIRPVLCPQGAHINTIPDGWNPFIDITFVNSQTVARMTIGVNSSFYHW